MIRVDSVWMATAPLDMRAGPDTLLMRVVRVFGSAHPHHAYVFANRRCDRIKILVHDGIGIWLAARRLNQGRFVWTSSVESTIQINSSQLSALTIGLPWQKIGNTGIISIIRNVSVVSCLIAIDFKYRTPLRERLLSRRQ